MTISDKTFNRNNPATAVIKERFALTKPGSTKQVYHISLRIEQPLTFRVGDSIAIFPQNEKEHVEAILEVLGASGNETITDPRSKEPMSLSAFLLFKANLRQLTSSFLKSYQHYFPNPQLEALLENREKLSDYLKTHEPYDLLLAYKGFKLPLQELCALFSPLLPRFYSVASSPICHPEEVHLTVALTVYPWHEGQRYGVASRFLSHIAEIERTPIPIYVQKAPHFTLPQEDLTPIIMVGPGTGIAPFRGFMQERLARSAKGKNWLIFGERHKMHNYYYQEFWEELSSQGHLKLDTAFSRDQEEKIYVQHLMQTRGKELFAWLEEGAHFYVCGDAARMAKDVDAALHQIIQNQAALSPDAAKAYVKALKQTKRYLTDIY